MSSETLLEYSFRVAFWMDFEALGAPFGLISRPPETVFGIPAKPSHSEKLAWGISG